MSDNYNFKVIDFGDAKYLDEVIEDDEIGGNMDARRDTYVGTLNYIAPEVVKGDP